MEKQNRLGLEKSPYLLQHAHNPVDWYPWSEEAFAKAAELDRPVFLSIGYSTCHWCHVMAHESFEDSGVAALLNDHFIAIKVDREERPDIDNIYMSVCQMLTGRGGWPLTIIMTPHKKPFFAGTYIPRTHRGNLAGMTELLPEVISLWKNRRDEIERSAQSIIDAVQSSSSLETADDIPLSLLDEAYLTLRRSYDVRYGGFGFAPKFPSAHNLLFLLRYWKYNGTGEALEMVTETLRHMRRGGIFDQLGYGFHRYSTDREWLVPHFEKMLYDQALLALAYLETFQATGEALFGQVAHEIFTYVLREMRASVGAFYSAQDADSEGKEGSFYLWEEIELDRLLASAEARVAKALFSTEPGGNYYEESTRKKTGLNILHLTGIGELQNENLSAIRDKLLEVRASRVRPQKDDKILTDWNALMIAALARGSKILQEPKYLQAAEEAARFILKEMKSGEGRLLHRYRAGEAAITGKLDDYSFFVWALLELYDVTLNEFYLEEAMAFSQSMISLFKDSSHGGLFFTPADGETLPVRTREYYDAALPSGNSVAVMNFLKLDALTGNDLWKEQASSIARSVATEAQGNPTGYTMLLSQLPVLAHGLLEIVLTGDREATGAEGMIREIHRRYLPHRILIFRPDNDNDSPIFKIAPHIQEYKPMHGKFTAYVCKNRSCYPLVTEIEQLGMLLA